MGVGVVAADLTLWPRVPRVCMRVLSFISCLCEGALPLTRETAFSYRAGATFGQLIGSVFSVAFTWSHGQATGARGTLDCQPTSHLLSFEQSQALPSKGGRSKPLTHTLASRCTQGPPSPSCC